MKSLFFLVPPPYGGRQFFRGALGFDARAYIVFGFKMHEFALQLVKALKARWIKGSALHSSDHGATGLRVMPTIPELAVDAQFLDIVKRIMDSRAISPTLQLAHSW